MRSQQQTGRGVSDGAGVASAQAGSGAAAQLVSDQQGTHLYRSKRYAFRLQTPGDGWRRINAPGAVVAFHHDGNAATIAVGARCDVGSDDIPLQALMNHLFFQFTERESLSQATIALAGREALRVRVRAKLDGVAVIVEATVLKRNQCVYDFMHIRSATDAASDSASDPVYEAMLQSFQPTRDK